MVNPQNTLLQYFHINWFSWLRSKLIPFSLRRIATTTVSLVTPHSWQKIILLEFYLGDKYDLSLGANQVNGNRLGG